MNVVYFCGCSMELPNCTVVLKRMTDEEINHYCAPGRSTETAKKVKTGLKTRKRTHSGETRKKMRPGKQVASKTGNTEKLKRRYLSRKPSGSSSDFTLDWSLDDETKSESEAIKIKLKRRRKFKKVCHTNVSSLLNAMETVANTHPLNTDANSILQSPNLSSKCDHRHQEKTSTFDSSANCLRGEQNNNVGQICGIIPNSEQLSAYSAVEDIPLSILKNMSELELKNTVSFFNSKVQSSVNNKVKPLRRKRNKRLKISPRKEKSGSGKENVTQQTNNEIEIQKSNNEVDVINFPLLTPLKENEGTFLFDHNSGGLDKSAIADWNDGTSLKSSEENHCSFRCHSEIDNLPHINFNSDEGLKSNESEKIKTVKKIESEVTNLKKSALRKYRRKAEQKASLLIKELNGKPDPLIREGKEKKNSYNEVINNNATNIFVKTNEPNKKLNHRDTEISKEAIIASSKQNQSERFPKHLIVKRLVGGCQNLQDLDKTILHGNRKYIKINKVNVAHMQKGHYSCMFPKNVKTGISVTKSVLNTSPPIKYSLGVNKWKLALTRNLLNSNYSSKPDQKHTIIRLQNPCKLLVGNQSNDEQFKKSFKEENADKRFNLTNFTDTQEIYLLQDKCQSLQTVANLKIDEIYELSNIKKTPENTDTKDDYLSLCRTPTTLSPVQSNHIHIKENFQNKTAPFESLKVSTSPPQSDDKRDFNKTVPCVKYAIKGLTDEIPHQNANIVLDRENNLLPVCGLINHSSSERHNSTKTPTCSKKARLSHSVPFDFVNNENSKIKISDVCSLKYPENRDPHLTESDETTLAHININDLNHNASESNMSIAKDSCVLSSNEKTPTEMHLTKIAEPHSNNSLKQTCKTFENDLSAAEILEVVTLLAIADLGENPQSYLKSKIEIGVSLLKELLRRKRITLKLSERIQSIKRELYVLDIAEQYLNFYGSFSNVSDYFLKDF